MVQRCTAVFSVIIQSLDGCPLGMEVKSDWSSRTQKYFDIMGL